MNTPVCPLCGHPADLVGRTTAKVLPARPARTMPPSERVDRELDRRAWARWEAAMEDMGGHGDGDE